VRSLDFFLDIAMGRRSVRRYTAAPVDGALLDLLIESARWAPSPQNRQGWKFTVITDGGKIAGLADAVRDRWDALVRESGGGAVSEGISGYSTNFSWFKDAPVLVVVSARRPESFMNALFGDAAGAVSGSAAAAAMAAQNLMLAAHSAGLGSCCITGAIVAEGDIARLTGLNGRWSTVCIVSIGYPDETPVPPDRKNIDEVLRYI